VKRSSTPLSTFGTTGKERTNRFIGITYLVFLAVMMLLHSRTQQKLWM